MIHIPQFFEELEALEAKGDYTFKLSSVLVLLMKKREHVILIKRTIIFLTMIASRFHNVFKSLPLNSHHNVHSKVMIQFKLAMSYSK